MSTTTPTLAQQIQFVKNDIALANPQFADLPVLHAILASLQRLQPCATADECETCHDKGAVPGENGGLCLDCDWRTNGYRMLRGWAKDLPPCAQEAGEACYHKQAKLAGFSKYILWANLSKSTRDYYRTEAAKSPAPSAPVCATCGKRSSCCEHGDRSCKFHHPAPQAQSATPIEITPEQRACFAIPNAIAANTVGPFDEALKVAKRLAQREAQTLREMAKP